MLAGPCLAPSAAFPSATSASSITAAPPWIWRMPARPGAPPRRTGTTITRRGIGASATWKAAQSAGKKSLKVQRITCFKPKCLYKKGYSFLRAFMGDVNQVFMLKKQLGLTISIDSCNSLRAILDKSSLRTMIQPRGVNESLEESKPFDLFQVSDLSFNSERFL